VLVIVAGLPGTGKTTVAAALARELGATVLSTDKIRDEGPRRPGFSRAAKGGVYDTMFERAGERLRAGRSVILDATFYLERLRARGRAAGRGAGAPVFVVEVIAPERIVRERMDRRLHAARGRRAAGFEVHGAIRKSFEPVRGKHFVLDTARRASWRRRIVSIANAMRVAETHRRLILPLLRSRELRLIQTHISWILLNGSCVYKIKKPVRFSFVDYRSPARRRAFCLKEVAINSRFSPDLYLGVVPVREEAGRVTFGGRGRTVDHAVKMLELPQALRLDRLVAAGRAGPDDIRRIARTLCDIHGRAETAPRRCGSARAIREGFAHSFALRPLIEEEFSAGGVIDRIETKMDAFLAAHKDLFRSRVRDGRIRYCHGDVRMSNIFIAGETVHFFDAVEFNPRLSCSDVAADVAYLSMDLRTCGKPDLADRFVDAYVACSGDEGLRRIADFYELYRALVRLLVESLFLADPEIGGRRKARARQTFKRYLGVARDLARRL
jgi:aminoglycoside phosphotransferase family enzyme/predicted kinase